jgi:molybdopterin converting factor small subunit
VTIRVVPVGVVKNYAVKAEIPAEPGLTAGRIVQRLQLPARLKINAFINGRKQPLDTPVQNGDEIKIVSTFAGG